MKMNSERADVTGSLRSNQITGVLQGPPIGDISLLTEPLASVQDAFDGRTCAWR
jgi:hypothetical protein